MSLKPPSEKQQQIIDNICSNNKGKFIIRACPGSGKTFTVANLFCNEIKNWKDCGKGLAVISFTNVAHQEIRQKAEEIMHGFFSFGYPHFIGTIDSFLNQNVFLPFGSSSMGCKCRPKLVGKPHGEWQYASGIKWSSFFEYIHYKIDGSFENIDCRAAGIGGDIEKKNRVDIFNAKKEVNKMGFATQNDANYFSYKTLVNNFRLAKLLASRYPYLIIDEAQDSTEIQMAIIDILIVNGLEKIVLVGDPDQAIFEWNNAKPKLFEDKIKNGDWKDFKLNESYRSSANICKFASKFRGGENFGPADLCDSKVCSSVPCFRTYKDNDDVKAIKEEFKSICLQEKIEFNSKTTAILYKASTDLSIVNEVESENSANDKKNKKRIDWKKCTLPYTQDLCKAKFLFDNGDFKKSGKLFIAAAAKKKYNNITLESEQIDQCILDNGGEMNIFIKSIVLLNKLSPVNGIKIADWIKENSHLFPNEKNESFGDNTFDDVFAYSKPAMINKDSPLYSTIHGVKGKTFDGVLVYLKSRVKDGKNFTTYLKNGYLLSDEKIEAMRIVYVAITRPRKVLMIAVPQIDIDCWNNYFQNE